MRKKRFWEDTEEDTRSLSYNRIDKQRFFLNRIEKEGIIVNQFLDLHPMTLYTAEKAYWQPSETVQQA